MAKKAVDEAQAAEESMQRKLMAAGRLLRTKKARESLIDFTVMSMPDPSDPDNPDLSRYKPAMHHELIGRSLEKVETGEWPRLIITMPPRHGKSELATKRFPAWFTGRDPYRSTIVATYADDFAEEFGREVREIMRSPLYGQVFPGIKLRSGSAAADRLQMDAGGILAFVGRKGRLTGRGADLLLIDDPIKDREEADSPAIRNKVWGWFTDVAMSRLMTDAARVVIIMTRWHEDDIVGRLTDPDNQSYNADEAAKWRVLKLPALAEENDPLGREPGAALWPSRISREFLEGQRNLNPRGFEALYQGNPAPDDGDYFRKSWIDDNLYKPDELPHNLRVYVASDHAVSTEQNRDATCLLAAGVDSSGVIWILPDCWWRREKTDDVVDGMLDMGGRLKPLIWWAEKGHISKSIGPFLRKRMMETQTYFRLEEVTPVANKETRAQSIQGRMAMGMVKFPGFAPWWGRAEQEIVKFPSAKHDDFVDALALLGLGLSRIVGASDATMETDKQDERFRVGSIAWVKHSTRRITRRNKINSRGM